MWGGIKMKKKETNYQHIERNYIITSKELKFKLSIEGDIQSINLCKGRSPNDIEKGKSADLDEWELNTIEQGTDGEKDNLRIKQYKKVENEE